MDAAASGGSSRKPVQWLRDLFRAVDARDTARFLQFLTDDASFRFGNFPACKGKHDIGRAVDAFFKGIAACRHNIAESWEVAGIVVCHGSVTYTRHDDSQVTVPFANVLARREGLITEYLIFADVSPLFSAAQGAGQGGNGSA